MSGVTIEKVLKDPNIIKDKQKRLDYIKKKLIYNAVIPRPIGSLVYADNHCPRTYMMVSIFNNFFITPKINSYYGAYQLSYIKNAKCKRNLQDLSETQAHVKSIDMHPSVYWGFNSVHFKLKDYVAENNCRNHRIFENGMRIYNANPFEYFETFGEFIKEEYI